MVSSPIGKNGSKLSTGQPYVNIKIRDPGDSYFEEMIKPYNDPIFAAPTEVGDFTGIRFAPHETIIIPTTPETSPTTTIEPSLRITVILPPYPLIHAHFRGNRHLIYEDSEPSKQVNSSELLERFYGKLTPRPTTVVRDCAVFDSALVVTERNRGFRRRTTESAYDDEEEYEEDEDKEGEGDSDNNHKYDDKK